MGGKILADAISAKLILGDDNTDQDILDQHVSRVWSDLTPLRSPGNLSPCTQQLQKKKNPELNPAIAGGCKYTSKFRLKNSSFFHKITQVTRQFELQNPCQNQICANLVNGEASILTVGSAYSHRTR